MGSREASSSGAAGHSWLVAPGLRRRRLQDPCVGLLVQDVFIFVYGGWGLGMVAIRGDGGCFAALWEASALGLAVAGGGHLWDGACRMGFRGGRRLFVFF